MFGFWRKEPQTVVDNPAVIEDTKRPKLDEPKASVSQENTIPQFDFSAYQKFETAKTAWGRVVQTFSRNDYGFDNFGLYAFKFVCMGGFLTGMTIGCISTSRRAYESFVRRSRSTIFLNERDAKTRMMDYIHVQALKDGFKWAFNIAALSGMTTTTLLASAAAKDGLWPVDFVISPAISCGLHRFYYGFRAMFSGVMIGSTFGIFIAVIVWPMSLINGISMTEMYHEVLQEYFEWKLKNSRDERRLMEEAPPGNYYLRSSRKKALEEKEQADREIEQYLETEIQRFKASEKETSADLQKTDEQPK